MLSGWWLCVIVSTLTCLCCRFIDLSCTYSTDSLCNIYFTSILSLSNSSITLQEQKASKFSFCYLQDVLSETRAIEIKMVSLGHRASQRSPFPIILALSSSVALWDLVFSRLGNESTGMLGMRWQATRGRVLGWQTKQAACRNSHRELVGVISPLFHLPTQLQEKQQNND